MKSIVIMTALAGLTVATAMYVFSASKAADVPARQARGLRLPDLNPRSGDSVPSPEFLKAQAAVENYRSMISSKPEQIDAYTTLAQIYLQEARISGEHHLYLPVADTLLDAALARDSSKAEAIMLKASISMTLHRFDHALRLIQRAVALNAYSAHAYGTLCDALVEMGNYAEAVKTCDTMMALRPSLGAYARVSYLRELHGDKRGAIDAMTMAVKAGVPGEENWAWAAYNLGNLYLLNGSLDTADIIYKSILEVRPNYPFAMSGQAAVFGARKNYPEAIELLVRATRISPEHIFVEQLADIYAALEESEGVQAMREQALDAFAQHERDGWNIDREYAQFCANHGIRLDDALRRAERDYRRRPDNIDALQTYAWALYKNGKVAEAVPLINRAMRLDTNSAMLNYYAGMIFSGLNDSSRAVRHLRNALERAPYLTVVTRQSAENAMERLGQSLPN